MNRPTTFFLLATALFGSASATALNGTATMTIRMNDTRAQCDLCEDGEDNAGCDHDTCGQTIDFAHAFVELRNATNAVGDGSTSATGVVSITWNEAWCFTSPCALTVRVYLKNWSDFEVKDGLGAQYTFSTNVSVPSGISNIGTFSVGGTEKVQVYQTADEFWTRLIESNTFLASNMGDRLITFPGLTTYAPCTYGTLTSVSVATGDGTARPYAVAHEIGHCATDVAYGVGWIGLGQGGTCGFEHRFTRSVVCEELAFHEGVADWFGVMWAYNNNAIDAEWEGVDVERMNGSECIGTNCRTERCIAAALWDVHDDPNVDDDPIDGTPNVTYAQMIDTFVQYQDNCTGDANRCSNEGGDHGRNHWDWLENFDDNNHALADEVLVIYDMVGIDGTACEEPFTPSVP